MDKDFDRHLGSEDGTPEESVSGERASGASCLTAGTAGIRCHLAGGCMTVSALAMATGGIGRGRMVEASAG